MPRKAFKVAVELEIQAVTCPGVWLCPKGEVSLLIAMLDSSAATPPLPPVFPLLYHARLLFRKTVHGCRRLADLQSWLAGAALRVQLVQRFAGRRGGVLATFETSLEELLYPAPGGRGLVAGVDIDLLMEPTASFPGILAPKIEVSTRTTIEEVFNSTFCDECDVTLVNPKTISSKSAGPRRQRQEKVCHSRARVRFICPTARPRICVRKQPVRSFAQRGECDPRCKTKCRPDCCASDSADTSAPEEPFKWQSNPANQRSRRSRSQCPRYCSANGLQERTKSRDEMETRSRSRCDPRDNPCDICTSYEQVFQTSGGSPPASKPRPYSCMCESDAPRRPEAAARRSREYEPRQPSAPLIKDTTCPCSCLCKTDFPRRPEAAARLSQEYGLRQSSAPLAGDTTQSSSLRTSLDDTTAAQLNVEQSYPSSYTAEYPTGDDGGYPLADVHAATSQQDDVASGNNGGYREGNNGGYQEGNNGGYQEGNNRGYQEGNNGGYQEGNNGGYQGGNNGGYREGNNGGYQDGNNGGYREGNNGGYREGNSGRYQEGNNGGDREENNGGYPDNADGYAATLRHDDVSTVNNGGYRAGIGGGLAGNGGGLAGNGGDLSGNNGGYPPRDAGGYVRTSQHRDLLRDTTSGVASLPPLPPPNSDTSRNQFYRNMGNHYAQLQHVDTPCSELCRC